jgi:hypothetical protein
VLTVAPDDAGALIVCLSQSSTFYDEDCIDMTAQGAGPTGAPLQPLFGNVDFKAYNIDFQNRAVSSLFSFPRHSFINTRS